MTKKTTTPQNKEINTKINTLKEELSTITESWKRACADYANLEQRSAQTIQDRVNYTTANLIRQILPVLDSLEKALEQEKDGQGLQAIRQQLWDILQKVGVGEVAALGKKFDPTTMEAVITANNGNFTKKETNATIVIEVVEKGYKLGEKLIRPAKVVV